MSTPNYYAIDSYDKLFCKCDGTTTTFVDSSTASPKTITANGNATQLPIKLNKSAGFFNGTTDYVVVPDSADWDFGTGDFNFEVFFNTSSVAADLVFMDRNSGNDFKFFWDQSEGKYGCTLEGTAYLSSASTPTVNTWTHIRMKRTSGTLAFYVNAVATGTADASASDVTGTAALYIGSTSTPNTFYSGWMKELRLIKGASTDVSTPTSEYTSTSEANTKLLMHFDTPATSPLGPAIYFDGNGDYLTVPNGGDFDVGSGDFAIEFFANCVDSTNIIRVIFDSGTVSSKGIEVALAFGAAQYISVYLNGSAKINSATIIYTLNTWSHFRVERTGGRLKAFQDGRQVADVADTTSITAPEADPSIGAQQVTHDDRFFGYLREFVFVKGATIGGGNPYTPSQSGFTVDANTKLYIKGDENNGVTTFVDSETTPKTVTTAGDTKIKYTEDYRSCIFKDEIGKFPYPQGSAKVDFFAIGDGVGYFDATNSFLSIPDSEDWDFGTGTLTTELYVRWNSVGTSSLLYRGAKNWGLEYAAGHLYWYAETATINDGTWTPIANTWYHLAVSRDETNSILFLNGTVLDTDANSTDIVDTTELRIGVNDSTANDFNGILDNIRISKGVARYTATFNPPEFSTVSPTTSRRIFLIT